MKQKIILFELSLITFISIVILACEPPLWAEYEPPESPFTMGSYLVTDQSESSIQHYEMGTHWFGGKERQFELCNFAGNRVSAKANVLDENNIRIPSQVVLDENNYLEILQGSGTFTDSTFRITYWRGDHTGVHLRHEIHAELIK